MTELQGSVSKVQVAFADEVPELEKYVNVVNLFCHGKKSILLL